MSKVLLYSGGMDSWLIDKLWKPDVKLFVNIHTNNNMAELERVKDVEGVEIVDFDISRFEDKGDNYFLPLRNLYFVALASNYGDEICLGATGSSTHFDKTERFADDAARLINYLYSEKSPSNVKIVLPFKDTTKTQLLKMYLEQGGDINKAYTETVSCYNPNEGGTPCMNCSSCASKFVAFYNNGYKFRADTISAFIEYVSANKKWCKPSLMEVFNRLTNKVIAVDFDGTITDDTPYPVTGGLREYCKEAMDSITELGYTFILNTCRTEEELLEAKVFIVKNKLPVKIPQTPGKVRAQIYIDNKNLGVNTIDWRKIAEYFSCRL